MSVLGSTRTNDLTAKLLESRAPAGAPVPPTGSRPAGAVGAPNRRSLRDPPAAGSTAVLSALKQSSMKATASSGLAPFGNVTAAGGDAAAALLADPRLLLAQLPGSGASPATSNTPSAVGSTPSVPPLPPLRLRDELHQAHLEIGAQRKLVAELTASLDAEKAAHARFRARSGACEDEQRRLLADSRKQLQAVVYALEDLRTDHELQTSYVEVLEEHVSSSMTEGCSVADLIQRLRPDATTQQATRK